MSSVNHQGQNFWTMAVRKLFPSQPSGVAAFARRRTRNFATRANHSHEADIAISNLEPHVRHPYPRLQEKLSSIRRRWQRPLSLSQKILFSHLYSPESQELKHGTLPQLLLRPDRVACHDATATMAMLQFISAGLPQVALPTSIHCDHLIVAEKGAEQDLAAAKQSYEEVSSPSRRRPRIEILSPNPQVYAFLASACQKYDIGYWKPGAGIIHPIIFENYAL